MSHCASPSIQFTDDELNLHPSVWLGAGGWGMLGEEVPKESDKSVEETAITEQRALRRRHVHPRVGATEENKSRISVRTTSAAATLADGPT